MKKILFILIITLFTLKASQASSQNSLLDDNTIDIEEQQTQPIAIALQPQSWNVISYSEIEYVDYINEMEVFRILPLSTNKYSYKKNKIIVTIPNITAPQTSYKVCFNVGNDVHTKNMSKENPLDNYLSYLKEPYSYCYIEQFLKSCLQTGALRLRIGSTQILVRLNYPLDMRAVFYLIRNRQFIVGDCISDRVEIMERVSNFTIWVKKGSS